MYNKFFSRCFIVVFALLLSTNFISYSQTPFNVQDSLALRKLWLSLDGPNWKYPDGTSESQKWFNGESRFTQGQWLGAFPRGEELSGIELQKFMVPASGNLHYRNMKDFVNMDNFTIRNVPQVHQFQIDSIINYLGANLRYLYFEDNGAVGQLPPRFFENLPKLEELNLKGNQLTDSIPNKAIGAASQLVNINLSRNSFTGQIHTALFGLGAFNTQGSSRSINLGNNNLSSIVGAFPTGFGYYGLNFFVNNNQISEDNGFVQGLYNSSLYIVNFDISHNKLTNAKIASSLTLTQTYYESYPRYFTILPQTLGSPTTLDLKDLSAAITVVTDIKDEGYLGSMGYLINDSSVNVTEFTYAVNNGKATFTIPAGFFANNSHLVNGKCTIRPYVMRDPIWNQSYMVEFAPVVIRRYQSSQFTLTGLDALVCKSQQLGGNRFKYKLEAIGVDVTDIGTISMTKTSVSAGVPKDSTFVINLTTVPDLLKNKVIQGEHGFKGESCTLKITSVTLRDKNSVVKTCSFQNVLNTTRIAAAPSTAVQAILPDYYCSYGNPYTIKIVKPEAGVTYSFKNLSMLDPVVDKDTMWITAGIFTASGTSVEATLMADIDGGCAISLATKTSKVVGYVAPEFDIISTTPPSCSSDAVLNVVGADPDYLYYPTVNYRDLTMFEKAGTAAGDLEFKIPIYELNSYYNNVRVNARHKVCFSTGYVTMNDYYALDFNASGKVKAMDSLALIHFVEKTGYKPDGENFSWYGRNIAYGVNATQQPIYMPINEWNIRDGSAYLYFVGVKCGNIVGLDFNSNGVYSFPIGIGKTFQLSLDSLPELRDLSLTNNGFIGSFDNPRPLASSHLRSLSIEDNGFSDLSFSNMEGALKGTQINANNNNLTFLSLLKINNNYYNNLMPQREIPIDTTISIYEGQPLRIKNSVPDTKDGMLHYYWHHQYNYDVLSTERDLYIEKVPPSLSGSIICEVQHEQIQSRSESIPNARLDSRFPALQVRVMNITVTECGSLSMNAGYDHAVCSADSVKLYGSYEGIVSNPSVSWTAGTGNFNASTGSNSLVTAYKPSTADITAGFVDFILKITTHEGNCEFRDTMRVTLPLTPATPAAIAVPAKCSADTVHTILNKTTTPKGQYIWYSQSVGGAPKANPFDAGNVKATTVYYLVDSMSTTHCASKRTAVTVTVNTTPAAPTVPTVAAICYGAKAVLNKTPTSAKYFWYADSVGGKANANPYTTPALTKSTNYYLVDSSTATKCVSARVKLPLTVRAMIPKPDSVALPAVCEGVSVTLRTNATATGQFFWYASATGGVSKKQGDPSGALLANSSFYVIDSVLSTKCTSVRTKVDVTVNPRPDTPSAPIITVCKGGNTTLLATEASVGNYYWYTNALGGKPLANGTVLKEVLADTKYYLSDSSTVTKCASIRKEVPISVTEPVLPLVGITASDEDICKDETARFEATTVYGGAKPTFIWVVNEFVTDSTASTFSSNSLVQGDKVYARMVSSESCVSQTTVSSNEIMMNVVSSVVPEVRLREFEGPICAGSEVYFEAVTIHGGEKPTYVWKVNTANVGDNTSVFRSSTLQTGDVVSVELTSTESCASNPKAVSNDIKMDVSPLVSPEVKISASETEICEQQQVYFGYSATHQGFSPGLEWRLNSEVVSTNVEFSSNTLVDGDTVSLRLTSNDVCLKDTVAVSNELVFKVNATTHVVSISTPDRVCNAESATVVVEAQGAGLSYRWMENESGFRDSTLFKGFDNDTLTLVKADTLVNENTYFVEVTGKCGVSYSSAASFSVLQSPSITVQPLATTTCASGTAPFEVQATGSGPLNYQWFEDGDTLKDGGVYEGVGTSRLILTRPDFGFNGRTYVVKVSNECTTSASSTPVVLTVTDVVTIGVSIQTVDSTLCIGDTARFTATAFNAGIDPMFSWRINGEELESQAKAISFTNLENGDKIDCILSVSDACVVNSEISSNVITMKVDTEIPQIIEVAMGSRCDTGSVTLGAFASKGEVRWYAVSDTLTSLGIGNTFITPILAQSSDFYVKAYGESCVSAKTLVMAHVEEKALVDAGADQVICRNATFIPLQQVTNFGPLAWDLVAGFGNLQIIEAIPSGYYLDANDRTLDKLVFRMYSQTEICPSESDTVTYTFGIPKSVAAGTEPVLFADSLVMVGLIQNNFPSNSSYDVQQANTWVGVKTSCGAITDLNLSRKGLSGTLSGIENLNELKVLDLSYNQLDSIETELNFISHSIQRLDLSHNQISYTRPLYLGFTDLDTLNLSNNRFASEIQFLNYSPDYVSLNNTHLQSVRFHYLLNQVPLSDFATEHLDIGSNGLSKEQIEGLSLLDSLRYFDASHNQFEGGMLDMTLLNAKLSHLDLSHNYISANVILSSQLSALKYLDLSHNRLNMLDESASLTSFLDLQYLDLGNNLFANTAFDQDLSALTQLKYFAIDSNAVAHTEEASGFVSLPLLPSNAALVLSVHNNHLQYDDLYPYKSLFTNVGSRYSPQYDTVDQAYVLKPMVGVTVRLSTTLADAQNKYQWKKHQKLSSPLLLSIAKDLEFKFAATDTGSYFVEISNSDFPGLSYVRRNITLQKCDVGYIANVQLLNSLACAKADTLMAKLTYGDLTFPQNLSYQWNYQGLKVEDAFHPKLTAYVSGNYYFSAYDSSSFCLINSNVVAVNNVDRNDPVLQFNIKDSTIVNAKEYSGTPNFQWFINGLPIAGANEPTLRVYYNGTYQLAAQSSGDCVYSSKYLEIKDFPHTFVRTEHVVNQKGQVVLHMGGDIEVYPNPAIDQFAIKNLMVGATVQLVNLQGEVMMEHVADQSSMEIKATDLSKGVYLLNIRYQNSNTWEKIVIQ